ncbi:hypothetical protein Tcan_08478 [Toxocara canis]|uniref:Uncharacterized protein n=1 Tax=Toxocara canis TaxID=6265 RepID=A0A0B2VW38_TOXCA|nr:hypothetical protein Tcan_08478 [Toxocara canis]
MLFGNMFANIVLTKRFWSVSNAHDLMQLLTVGVLLILLDSSSSFYMLAAPGRLYRLRDDPIRSRSPYLWITREDQ